jgi:hypothetical protein
MMDDGSENMITDHLRDDHRKGTRGLSDDYLAGLHHTLHEPGRSPEAGHGHPGGSAGEGQPGQ